MNGLQSTVFAGHVFVLRAIAARTAGRRDA